MIKRNIYLLLAFIIIFNSVLYANSLSTDRENINKAYVEYSREILEIHAVLADNAIREIGKVDLTYKEVIALEKAKNTGLTYLAYPGSVYGINGNIGIEKFNADIISGIFDLDIDVVTIKQIDENLENVFATSLKLLDEGEVDIIGKFKYAYDDELSQHLVSSNYYAKEYIYDIYLTNKMTEGQYNNHVFNESRVGEERYAVTQGLSFLNNIDYFDEEVEVFEVEEVYEKLLNEEIDYFLSGNYEMSQLSQKENIMIRAHKDTSIYPNNIIVADAEENKNLITAINKIYTPEVLSIYDEYTEVISEYNKLYAFMKKGTIYNNIEPLKVGVFNVPSLIEKKDDKWTGYIIEIFEEINNRFEVEFIYYDYNELGYDKLVEDFKLGKIDLIPIITESMLLNNKWNINKDNVGIIPLRESIQLELFYKEDNLIKYYEQLPLRKIGIYKLTEPLIYNYIENYIDNYNNIVLYDDINDMFMDLLNEEINLVFELKGTDKYLKDRDAYVFNTKLEEVDDNFHAIVNLELLDDGRYLHSKLTDLVMLVDVDKIKTEELYFDINETYISNITKQIDFWLASLLIVVSLNLVAVYFIFLYKNKNKKLLKEVNRAYEGTEFNNRAAFIEDIIKSEDKTYICTFVKIYNLRKLQDYYGNKNFSLIFDEFLRRLSNISKDDNLKIYFIQQSEFVIVMPNINLDIFNRKIKDFITKIDNSYEINRVEEKLRFNMISINMRKLTNNEDALYYFNYFISGLIETEEFITHSFLDKESQRKFINNRKIIKVLTSVDISQNIRVKFKPIIDIENNKVIGAQTKIYLSADKLIVSREEYQQLAIMSGKLATIDFETIIKVRAIKDKFVSVGLISEDFIFSTKSSGELITQYKFLKEDMYERINGLEFSNIQLEISEEDLENRNLIEYLDVVKGCNFKIAISDFSAGHSSMEKIDIIKLENIIFKDSFMNSKQNIETSFKIKSLIDNLGCNSIYTNVTSKENLNQLKENNIKYIIGDLSNEDYTISEFTEIIKKYNS